MSTSSGARHGPRSGASAVLMVALTASGCVAPPPPPASWVAPDPVEADEIDSVVFLIGDAGTALPGRSPVLASLRNEVERWSGELARDSAVSVLYLGDIVYPVGVRDRTHPEFGVDSLLLVSQVEVVAGPFARRHASLGIFLAGNHDWGQMTGPEGLARLRNLEALVNGIADERDLSISLEPPAGGAGPVVIDLGERVRILPMDTHWWLQARNDPRLERVTDDVAEAIRSAGEREILMAAHHPFESGGVHGAPIPIWRGLGLLSLLQRSGAMVQDMNSVAYTEFKRELVDAFSRTRPPLIWAGGHDHSLQVIEGGEPEEPTWSIVSGSGSKLTGVVDEPGIVYGEERPGYMRVTVLKDGGVLLHVVAGAVSAQHCRVPEPALESCMRDGLASFQTVFATRLR